MYLPLNVLLFELSACCDYEAQNVNLTQLFEGIKLFNSDAVPDQGSNYLYLVPEHTLVAHASSLLSHQILSGITFLCVCSQADCQLSQLHSDLSMVLLHTNEPFASVFNRILALFFDITDWDKKIHMALLQQKSMQELLELSHAYLGGPTLVLDRNNTVLGQYEPPEQSTPLIEKIRSSGYVPHQLMAQLRHSSTDIPGCGNPNMRLCWYYDEWQKRCCAILYHFQANGHDAGCALLLCGTHAPKNEYLHLFGIICGNLSLYFRQERLGTLFSTEDYEALFVDILEHPDTPATQFERKVDFIPGLTMQGTFVLALLEYDPPSHLPHTAVGWNLRSLLPDLRPFVWNGRFYILRATSGLAQAGHFLRPQEEQAFVETMRDVPFLCAVSQPFFSLMELPTAAEQCEAVSTLGHLPKGRTQTFSTFEENYGLYLLQQLKRDKLLPFLRSPQYEVLRRYDEGHGTDLCTLFMQFLENQHSINQTAAAAYLHRNTVMNRIKKAVEIMGSECEGCGAQTAFFLSYLNDHPNGLRQKDR